MECRSLSFFLYIPDIRLSADCSGTVSVSMTTLVSCSAKSFMELEYFTDSPRIPSSPVALFRLMPCTIVDHSALVIGSGRSCGGGIGGGGLRCFSYSVLLCRNLISFSHSSIACSLDSIGSVMRFGRLLSFARFCSCLV